MSRRYREDVRTALPKLRPHYYKTLYMDPPWNQPGSTGFTSGKDGVPKGLRANGSGAGAKYETMKQKDLLSLSPFIHRVTASAAHLYLWTTNQFLPDALELVDAYGFEYITMITWDKGRDALGVYFRSRTEHCIFATTKKRIMPRARLNSVSPRATQQGSTFLHEAATWRGVHSEKPAAMREVIERISWTPRLELFARKCPKNWDAIGFELEDL
jgi:N6-adenosine-specific RNA methylase IME4